MPTIKYKLANGDPVKGATTIKGNNVAWGKQPLMYWANKQGLEGKTLKEAYNTATVSGTIAHLFIECFLKDVEPDLSNYSQEDIEKAQVAFENFKQWIKQFRFEPVLIEPNWVSEYKGYGGTPDVIGKVMGRMALIDWKTGRIHEDLFLQLAAYAVLAEEHDIKIEEYHVLRIPKNEDQPSFHHSYWKAPLPDEAWEAFEAALVLNRCEPVLKKLL